jgi:predicted amidohydrolase YtcJ
VFVGENPRAIDVEKRLMLPGFVESHWHFATTFAHSLN